MSEPSESHHFPEPIAFAVGAVGEPGHRVFFLQIGDVMNHVSVKCEKQQAAALAEYLGAILEDLPSDDQVPAPVDPMEPSELEWVAGVIAVAYDEALDRIVVVIEELTDEDEDDNGADEYGPATVRVALTRSQVATFIEQARAAIMAGRPPCRLCGKPIDPAGHACPRLN